MSDRDDLYSGAATPVNRNDVPPVDATEARWDASDLDRCEHGRHSVDDCASCPGGRSSGNPFLVGQVVTRITPSKGGSVEVRIGTTYSGEPIWVRPIRFPSPSPGLPAR